MKYEQDKLMGYYDGREKMFYDGSTAKIHGIYPIKVKKTDQE